MIAPADKDTLKRSPLFSGGAIDPWDPDPALITIEDIAHGLANTNRFSGQTERPYSVAQHSIYVARILPPDRRLAGLLHDAPEFLTGDLPHHIKHGPGFLGMMWREMEAPISAAIATRFGLHPADLYDKEIKAADEQIFKYEWESLVERDPNWRFPICPMDWETARMFFLDSFARYTGGMNLSQGTCTDCKERNGPCWCGDALGCTC